MIKILIVDNNVICSKNLLNSIINQFEELQLVYIATSGKEGTDIIVNTHIDLVFWTISNNYEVKFMEQLINTNTIDMPQIIVISENTNLLKTSKKLNCVSEIINKSESNDLIIEKITHIISCNNNTITIQDFILSELYSMGYNIKYKGTQYILESIIYVYKRNNFDLLDNVEQNVYKYIGNKHHKTINNIKTNINKATNTRSKDKVSEFNLTAKKTIMMILSKINRDFK